MHPGISGMSSNLTGLEVYEPWWLKPGHVTFIDPLGNVENML